MLDENGVKRPMNALSRLMKGISSSNHGDFYCMGVYTPLEQRQHCKITLSFVNTTIFVV